MKPIMKRIKEKIVIVLEGKEMAIDEIQVQLKSVTTDKRILRAVTTQRVSQILRGKDFEKAGIVKKKSIWRIKNEE
jgi:hypothetical protein|tara:strand:+ start:511 stop:738 length:228 start_codon:yes stop_codon:yes gene_type:complete